MPDVNEKDGLWLEYYREFPYFSDQIVRPGCHPRKLIHDKRSEKAIVLVHGLTDSPFYMTAIADYFYTALGYNVYLPLLQCHGLKQPEIMEGVSLTQWKENVRFAIRAAASDADRVSIGGLSTGGALSLYLACTEEENLDHIYLFSAALGLCSGRLKMFGGVVEFLLRIPLLSTLDTKRPLVGRHPYRYDRVPLNSAGELAKLIQEIDSLFELPDEIVQHKRIFAAWSELDEVINSQKIDDLKELEWIDRFTPFVIPKATGVEHACVVLKEPVYTNDSKPGEPPLEAANPLFFEMMAVLHGFESAT